MPRDHYIPASVIGRFSSNEKASARERSVFVLRKDRKKAFAVKAENIGFVNDLYRVTVSPVWDGSQTNVDETSVDPALHGYEPALPQALDQLEQAAPVDLAIWLRTLVPYIASIFVRGYDFIPRFRSRPSLLASGDINTEENANGARFIELERLLAPVCCARWVVLHKDSGEPFVLNDLNLTGTVDTATGATGWAVPIGQNSVLGIFPKKIRAVARYHSGTWYSIIEHRRLDVAEARGFNDAMARLAPSYVIGSDQKTIERLAPILGVNANVSALMDSWPIDYKTRVAHARDWHRLISATVDNSAPDELGNLQAVEPRALAAGWCPPVGVVINMREFPTGLTRIGNVIRLTLDTPPNFQDYFIRAEEATEAALDSEADSHDPPPP
jgi:hypothetical protein